jgi:endonuclease/exonuclease/phosphatase family metal-dependent hydrolase
MIGRRGGSSITRRSLLRSIAGTAVVGFATQTASAEGGKNISIDQYPSLPEDTRIVKHDGDDSIAESTDDYVEADAVSLRSIAEFIDGKKPPRALFGNGPPFTPDRPAVSGKKKVRYVTDSGQYSYVKYPGRADATAYDLGMVNRTREGIPDVDLEPKGLVESHRWVDTDTRGLPQYRSIRNVADRHVEGLTHRCAWLNTQMLDQYSKQRARAQLLGRLFGEGGYRVVALGEVDKATLALDISEAYANEYTTADGTIDVTAPESDTTEISVSGPLENQMSVTYGPNRPRQQKLEDSSGLCSVVGERDGERRLVEDEKKVYDTNPPSAIQESFQRIEIEAGHDDVDAGFELFLTHLSANISVLGGKIKLRKKRKEQIDELVSAIETRQSEEGKPGWPKIAVGDFNVHAHEGFPDSEKADYEYLLARMDDAGMSDAWLTHGGPIGRTIEPHSGLDPGSNTGCSNTSEKERRSDPYCQYDDFDFVGGKRYSGRLDYVFIEEPRSRHAVSLDLSRIWRIATEQSCCRIQSRAEGNPFVEVGSGGQKYYALTDHAGLGFDLVTSPNP